MCVSLQDSLPLNTLKVRNPKEMEAWMEKVPESIKKATKRESLMLDCERATMQQEELVRRCSARWYNFKFPNREVFQKLIRKSAS